MIRFLHLHYTQGECTLVSILDFFCGIQTFPIISLSNRTSWTLQCDGIVSICRDCCSCWISGPSCRRTWQVARDLHYPYFVPSYQEIYFKYESTHSISLQKYTTHKQPLLANYVDSTTHSKSSWVGGSVALVKWQVILHQQQLHVDSTSLVNLCFLHHVAFSVTYASLDVLLTASLCLDMGSRTDLSLLFDF